MRRIYYRQLFSWPGLATASIVALMWITSPGNPFAERMADSSAGRALRDAKAKWHVAGTEEALKTLRQSWRESWSRDSASPWAGAEPTERREQGTRAIKLPPRIAAAFELDGAIHSASDAVKLPAPIFDDERELAGMANSFSGRSGSTIRMPESDLLAPDWAIIGSLALEHYAASASAFSDAANASNTASTTQGDSDAELSPAEMFGDQPSDLSATAPTQSDTDATVVPEPSILELFQVASEGLARSLQALEASPSTSDDASPRIASALPESVQNLARPSVSRSNDNDGRESARIDRDATKASDDASRYGNSGSMYVGDLEDRNSSDDSARDAGETSDAESDSLDMPQAKASAPFSLAIPGGWPVAAELERQLSDLSRLASSQHAYAYRHVAPQLVASVSRLGIEPADSSPIQLWTNDVAGQLLQLRSLERLGDPRAGSILSELEQLASEGQKQAEQFPDRATQIEWLKATHALNRRLAVWQPVWSLTSGETSDSMSFQYAPNHAVLNAVSGVRAELASTGDEAGWNRFLLLDAIEHAASSNVPNERLVVAQRVLSRLEWHKLDPAHRVWLKRSSVRTLAQALRPWASTAIDYSQLVSQIERQESDAIDLAGIDIADTVQTLRFTGGEDAAQLGSALNSHYRNANIRVALSRDLIERFMPAIEPQTVPVRTTMFGSRVRGVSDIHTDLKLALVPSKNTWSFQLRTLGTVATRSTGHNSGVAVRTSGQSHFEGSTPITISHNDMRLDKTIVEVNGRNQLRGIQSDYDNWPLVGTLVRSIALDRYETLRPATNRVSNRMMQTQISREIDAKANEKLATATSRMESTILGPLGSLRLDPMVIDMSTTEDRLLARYRLAGDWQLAANTPRPRAPHSSLMSLQVHQSAINNTLEQLVPRDKPQSIAEMVQSTAQLFTVDLVQKDDEVPSDVQIQFAQNRPITFEIEDGQVWVTLRVVQLTRDDSLDLRCFIVRAAYVPKLDGLSASLVRDGHLRISGPSLSMRERIPVRAIFNKVLSANREIPLVLPQMTEHPAAENLVISQLELRDGWMAIAVSEAENVRTALTTPREMK